MQSVAMGAAAAAAGAAVCGVQLYDRWVVAQPFDPIQAAVQAFREGKPVVVMDDEDRENEGDIIAPAMNIRDETVTLIVNETTGILCCPMPEERADVLLLPPMMSSNEDPKGTSFTVTCDAKGGGMTTGVSSADRAHTLKTLADPSSSPAQLTRPGHIFPLRARAGGVLTRRGHTEATVDLCRLAGLNPPVGVIGELVGKDGCMMRSDDCKRFARKHGLPIVTIEDLARVMSGEKSVETVGPSMKQTRKQSSP